MSTQVTGQGKHWVDHYEVQRKVHVTAGDRLFANVYTQRWGGKLSIIERDET